MTPLQQVHLRIQELGREYGHIPINIIVQEFPQNPHVAKHIEALVHLEFIYFADQEKENIILTESGKLAIVLNQ